MSDSTSNTDPSDMLAEFGLSRHQDPPAQAPDLGAIRAAISQDLDAGQGAWRRSGPMRYWPLFIAAPMAIGMMFFGPAAGTGQVLVQASAVAGAIAVLLCLVAAAVAPDRPALAERVALVGLIAALGAIGAQVALGLEAPASHGDLAGLMRCGGMIFAMSLLPFGLLFYMLRRSGAPLRPLHAVAIVVSALAMGGVHVWRSCPTTAVWHVLIGHVAIPAALAAVMAMAIYRLLRRKPLSVPVP